MQLIHVTARGQKLPVDDHADRRSVNDTVKSRDEQRYSVDEIMSIKTGVYSDLTIKCGKYMFEVHKVIVCTRSEYFATACKPGAFKEGQTGVIELLAASESDGTDEDPSADDPEAVKSMIEFLYGHDYEASAIFVDPGKVNEGKLKNAKPPLIPCGDCNTVMHAKMYALGSKYHIGSLKAVALAKFMEAASYAWNTSDFVEAMRLAYSTTPDEDKGIRDIVAQTIVDHQDVLLPRMEVETTVRGISGLAYDLLKQKGSTKPDVEGPSCNTCGGAQVRTCWHCRKGFVGCSCDTTHSNGNYYCKQCKKSHGY
ncbi:hypothetical protein LTR36_003963 [Oleoguttula mirabilis]|uniref:BTB domain-containing protein n=1 Tax=Oleoguttula mirabilis TaxID=1507867 RepID=A0AAV9JHY6_9PEZI|nr:hypothetical protein LTR36_003963 [Oleoguttula mirabilis]